MAKILMLNKELAAEVQRFGEDWREISEEFRLSPESNDRAKRLCMAWLAQGNFVRNRLELRAYILYWMSDHKEVTAH